jgi:hypothetical protein
MHTWPPLKYYPDKIIINVFTWDISVSYIHVSDLFACHMYTIILLHWQDELRDYRWYDSDMVHPSAAAVSYIYGLFEDTYMSEETVKLSEKILKVGRQLRA